MLISICDDSLIVLQPILLLRILFVLSFRRTRNDDFVLTPILLIIAIAIVAFAVNITNNSTASIKDTNILIFGISFSLYGWRQIENLCYLFLFETIFFWRAGDGMVCNTYGSYCEHSTINSKIKQQNYNEQMEVRVFNNNSPDNANERRSCLL